MLALPFINQFFFFFAELLQRCNFVTVCQCETLDIHQLDKKFGCQQTSLLDMNSLSFVSIILNAAFKEVKVVLVVFLQDNLEINL